MTSRFASPVGPELREFLEFKRTLGFAYARPEFALRSFDRFASVFARGHRPFRLEQAVQAWIARQPGRKPLTVRMEVSVLRQFYAHLHRRSSPLARREAAWPKLPHSSGYRPHILSVDDIHALLGLAGKLDRPPFRRSVYRALILLLYCTGIRLGEALRLQLLDLDMAASLLLVRQSKGRSRLVPFHRSLGRELGRYLVGRGSFAPARPADRVFVNAQGKPLSLNRASETIRGLLREAKLKPHAGRCGPRPYDLRHAFAVHRLTRWYRAGVDLQARLPWLSAYMGHDDILGTETYLTATPELLALTGHRFRRRYLAEGGVR